MSVGSCRSCVILGDLGFPLIRLRTLRQESSVDKGRSGRHLMCKGLDGLVEVEMV